MEYIVVFIFGAIFGSFLNVCIYRIPRGLSIVKPRSHCPECQNPINWYDNVPLVSYLVLGGKCHYCGARIPVRYFLVELTTALASCILLYYFSLTSSFFVYLVFTYILIVIVFIDIEKLIVLLICLLGAVCTIIMGRKNCTISLIQKSVFVFSCCPVIKR